MENELLRPYFNFHNSATQLMKTILSDGKQLAVGIGECNCL